MKLPPVRIELMTPGLRDQCSTTELKRRFTRRIIHYNFFFLKNQLNCDMLYNMIYLCKGRNKKGDKPEQ